MVEMTFPDIDSWFGKQARKEVKKDVLKRSDRIGQVIGIVGVPIVIIFFYFHLTSSSGFFTSTFGAFDAALFFGINAIGIVPAVIRLVKGRKSPARFFDIINTALMLITMVYFLSKFPFDFSHLADPLPASWEFLLNWISNGLANALMVLGILGMLFALPYQTLLYMAIRKLL
jgi:cytochrome bd-type quinol oxidase subunit 2